MSALSTDYPTLSNYQAIELIHESDRTLVYRGKNIESGQPAAIKLMRNRYPSFQELVQFRNQYAISKNLDLEGVIKTYAIERYENRYALIMEDMGGISLAEYEKRASLSLSHFLHIAIQLSDILHQLHDRAIIHKDIKPANILIHPETQQIKLIDFSISTLLPKERQTLQTPRGLEGTLAYISPEQTGRMNRGIDYRSDFYSLGVTLYELLVGSLPFTSEDALELIYAHIAVSPDSLSNWIVLGGELCPPTLSEIVMKLMAKNAEERYQSALGLKYDLEKCLEDYEETGKIESFELGERDICDRFIIPEKLYGRSEPVQMLLDSFHRVAEGNSEMMLVAGFSGIGKTAAIDEVHKPIVKNRGYFIKGKFDQFSRNIPLSAIAIALRNLMGQLLGGSDAELDAWKTQILEAVSTNGQVLIDAIPELERIIGQQPEAPQLSGTAAQNRFNLLFQKLITVFASEDHPLVIFLDDLQWADSASLKLIEVLMSDRKTSHLLLLGAYRDNEVFPAHPLMLTLAELEKQAAVISTITLPPLAKTCINQLVADTLSCTLKLATPLTELIYRKTEGNPFFTTQFLKRLYDDKFITFNREQGYWQCDLVRVQDASLTDDVVEFMAERLQKLPPPTQEVLKLAACIGNQFDLETLAIAREIPAEEVTIEIWKALHEGIVLPIGAAYKFFQGELDSPAREIDDVSYRFLHDRVQQAAYSLIPEAQKQATHLNIGQLLLENLLAGDGKSNTEANNTEINRDRPIFDIVNHFNLGRHLIREPEQRLQLARLNLQAGQQARQSVAYDAAFAYIATGLEYLPDCCWEAYYELTLQLYREGVSAACTSREFATMDRWLDIARDRIISLLDRIPFYETQIQAFVAQKQLSAAIELGLNTLEQLGETFSKNPQPEDFGRSIQAIKTSLAGRQIEDLIDLPSMEDKRGLAVLQILWRLSSVLVMSAPKLMPFCMFKAVKLSIDLGNSVLSAPAYATYGMILCSAAGDIPTGYRFGQLALKILDKYDGKVVYAKTLVRFATGVRHWQDPLQDTLPSLAEAYQLALEVGDLESAAICAAGYGYHSYFAGTELTQLEGELDAYSQGIEAIGQQTVLYWHKIYHQDVLNLLGESEVPWCLVGTAYDETVNLPMKEQYNDGVGLGIAYIHKSILCYLFHQFDLARETLNLAANYIQRLAPFAHTSWFYFYQALASLATYSLEECTNEEELPQESERSRNKLQHWARHAPANYQHKLDLIEAERCRVLGQKLEAMELYDRAIAGAKERGYIQEEALANELFAKFYLEWSFSSARSQGRKKEAGLYMQEAYYCYAQWGAKAKTKHLEESYPQLLIPILQQEKVLSTNQEERHRTSSIIAASTTTNPSSTSTIANISSILDFSSLLKTSQTLSGEIELDGLLSSLMKIILENAGATKGALLLTSDRGLQIEAIATRIEDSSKFTIDLLHQAIPLSGTMDLPVGLVRYVRHTQEMIILDASSAQEQFTSEPYILDYNPQSLLCLPLLERGQLIGILYVENRLTADAFTRDRVEVLEMLCAQAAISLENARLYRKAQEALHDLQNTQLQLVQNEKMATLGNLVAGVAHEINNPVGFISGNIDAAREYLQDLLHGLELYQNHASIPDRIMDEIADLDLDFITEDFPKLIASMETGCDRITNISTSLRTFSRLDTASKTEFNLHDGIESTLLILKYRLKANENRPAIEVVKHYGKIPLVKCYAGQINQVFMNLLANAIDALEEGDRASNRIAIATELSEDNLNIVVRITDNGIGMSAEVKKQIFEQGFTTKGVGKGTGLGMAIAKSIIEEKHGGAIACQSELGKGTEFIISLPIR
ncbi:trifunctional serine/threonine-protein kinase/ATP-binding protein/sensor histidine kinase [Roseofilum casamattae]|uniref:histidine kinase n=1 Tax=Roseofilum casamattae BLCC-M143 TaxID=3022442 RepID=A0ABT7BUU9_9CYAN|nr:ATP-binding sensor histidine kinase [Roseofilum casamattae]MDJ1182969.1 AAA family ATPase [Roseofilum casamattae BLCC-M143]